MKYISNIIHKIPRPVTRKGIRESLIGAFCLLSLSSCLEETFPTTSTTAAQMQQSESSLSGQNNAMAASVMKYGSTYSHAGYPSLMLWRDVYTGQMPVYTTTYDYFAHSTQYLGEGQLFYDWWYQYFNTIHQANALVGLVDAATAEKATLAYLGNAKGYRAWCYMEASQVWEYKKTGVSKLDAQADERNIWGLTVPIVTEKTTMEQARNNPRAPFYTMYRFIANDLTEAETYLDGYKRTQVNEMDSAAICGLAARFWLMLGSRFEAAPADLATQLAHETDNDGYAPLGITSAADCYDLAAKYAQKAIDGSGEPTTKDQWYDPKSGFNDAIQSWIFGIEMVPDDNTGAGWKNFVSFTSPEADFGVAGITYLAQRLCDQDLYDRIADEDWRKHTWISPDDVGTDEAVSNYGTLLSGSEFAQQPELCGLKFHPSQSERVDFKKAAAIDLPIMRVEEMYYILAEAVGRTQGPAAGAAVLNSFTNKYRYDEAVYACTPADMDELMDEILTQKRIEFWGEGIVFWDYKRLGKGVYTKYDGSNHPSSYQHNSPDGVVARWMNSYIPSNEYQYNKALEDQRNPDPSRTDDMEY